MRIDESKLVIFDAKSPSRLVKQVYEEDVPEGHLKLFKFILLLLFNKSVRWQHEYTIKYALRYWECYRGTGASDVLLFEKDLERNKCWEESK